MTTYTITISEPELMLIHYALATHINRFHRLSLQDITKTLADGHKQQMLEAIAMQKKLIFSKPNDSEAD